MGLKGLLGVSGCAVIGFFIAFVVVVVVLLAILIELFLPFGKDQAWAWMLNTSQQVSTQPPLPTGTGQPVIVGEGEWCVTKAYQQTPDQDHNNHGRVQGYVRDENGNPLTGVPVHVGWDGDEGGITEYTDANGYYVIILSPGSYYVTIGDGRASPRVYFRTNIKARWGHITYDVDFQLGICSYQFASTFDDPRQPCGTPVEGQITAGFQDTDYSLKFDRTHNGIDIAVPLATPTLSTMNGRVIGAGFFSGGYGYMVRIQNGPWEVWFEHLSRVEVALGDMVSIGQRIGLSGDSGDSTGPHVHYEVHYNGYPVDPIRQLTDNGYSTYLCAVTVSTAGGTTEMEGNHWKVTSFAGTDDGNWLPLANYPQPQNNNGQCVHWFPTPKQNEKVIDTFVPILQQMEMKWVVILQDPQEPNANDYLLTKLRQAKIMPIVRIMAPVGPVEPKTLGATVAHQRSFGVRYFQIFNEPNNKDEWGVPSRSPQWLARYWVGAAQIVLSNGGLPGLPPFVTDGSDLEYFQDTLIELKRLGRFDLLHAMWISSHNYGGMNEGGFFRYHQYQKIAQEILGHTPPILNTEGGLGTAEQTAQIIDAQFDFMRTQRDPYLFAYCPWLIGNSIGGGKDEAWEPQAWCMGALDNLTCRVWVGTSVQPK
ncbi:MAG: peptidoglycan DD-metalloendopeptidase family protein [Anaerolineae bacterium]|nr:peptidoglycan DD-metalloendopeptidase family protein [Anaerolineae bacterium]